MADTQGSQSDYPPVPGEGVWSVEEVNSEIESVLSAAQDQFPSYVIGEISDTNPYGFGTFFDLRDLNDDVTISCIMWAPQRQSAPHELTEGTETIVRATVDFYEDDGRTQISVRSFWPVGESDRTADLAALRSELESEGLLDEAATQPLPEFPRHIGVVTSLAGSARQDFCEAVYARHPGVTITVCGATVQGDGAPASLVAGIQRLEQDPSIDVVVVTRGGGADADLWCFNAEPVVRAIADCTTPTVVAVGHEDDDTLAEAVADRRAMTPTDAGGVVAPNVSAVRDDLGQVERRIDRAYEDLVTGEIDSVTQRLDAALATLEPGCRLVRRHGNESLI
jgi:exodeoxyribonuclease VII large subunit